MLTRGTKTRNAQQIAEFFDSIGGRRERHLRQQHLGVGCTPSSTRTSDKAMAAYADVVNNPTFPEDEAAAMKKRVIAGIAAQDADWFAQASRYFRGQFYGPMNSPYQFLAIGTKKNVEELHHRSDARLV